MLQGLDQNEAPKAPSTRRDAVNVEEVKVGKDYPSPIRIQNLGNVASFPSGVKGRTSAINEFGALYFNFYGTLLGEGKSNLFIDNYSGTNKPIILRIN